MKKLTLIFLVALTSCNSNQCEYANYEYFERGNDKPIEGFQILLHTVTDKRLELIGKNYSKDELWKFTSGSYITLNSKVRINIDEKFFEKVKDVDYFYSSELIKSQLGYLITEDIKTIEIHNGLEKHFAKLTQQQTRMFNDILNCNYINNRKRFNDLR